MEPVAERGAQNERSTADIYRLFGEVEADTSPLYREWALGVADDPEVIALIDELPPRKRQVNLVFAAARYLTVPWGSYSVFREWMLANWPRVRAVAETHATQTNEAGRCAVLLPLLARVPGPLALLEVGTSAGLCLYPERYSYRYGGGSTIDPTDGPSTVVLDCAISGPVPVPDHLPQVVWRAGVDLNPLDVNNADDMAWLDALIWPEHDDRRARLNAAVQIARADPPQIVRGDLNEALPALAASAPADATLVVFHTAVLAYLVEAERKRFVQTVTSLPGHWISNEGIHVTPGVAERLGDTHPQPGEFVLALDGDPVALAQPHGRALRWL
ncbi:DUF2332 domain-containing protein [Leifsonia sp. Root112D2]|uniref:DUF2332 domain-containing protein n=1 Tax=Leifsonia sp. Root112D2 TaxID=1736426 RepID=UPI0006F9840D|nr:DUF2332 domain-containing protein [Leifsonia sp. Root112D2]KQV07788.1 hypothetical protein ASC63_11370 [Leifsonia sp. Root112D2]